MLMKKCGFGHWRWYSGTLPLVVSVNKLGYLDGKVLLTPLVEFSFKNDTLGDPSLTCD